MRSEVHAAMQELRVATDALGAAVAAEDPAALEAALEARERAFARFAAGSEDANRGADLRVALHELLATGAAVLDAARTAVEQTRAGLAHLAEGHRALASLRRAPEPPRFLSRRV
jgi:hypothetical protein